MESPELRPFVSNLKERASNVSPDQLSYADNPLLPQDVFNLKKMFDLCCYNKVSNKVHLQVRTNVLLLKENVYNVLAGCLFKEQEFKM